MSRPTVYANRFEQIIAQIYILENNIPKKARGTLSHCCRPATFRGLPPTSLSQFALFAPPPSNMKLLILALLSLIMAASAFSRAKPDHDRQLLSHGGMSDAAKADGIPRRLGESYSHKATYKPHTEAPVESSGKGKLILRVNTMIDAVSHSQHFIDDRLLLLPPFDQGTKGQGKR